MTTLIAREPGTRTGPGQPVLHRSVLANGLRLVVVPQPGTGVVAIAVHYGVGYRAEPPDRAGFAHLFEHLMFTGSANVPKLAHYRYVQASGGSCNAVTARDYTCYHQVLPSGALERGLFLEADRMRAPRFSAAALANQVAVIREEIGANVHGRPYGGLPRLLLPPVLFNGFANTHSAYGTVVELSTATVADCEDFFLRYYTPANAVLTVTGDASPALVRELAERYFGPVATRPAPPLPDLAEPAGYTGREHVHHDPLAPLPATVLGWRLPAPGAAAELGAGDRMAYAALAAVLADGDSARLNRALVATGGAAHVRAAASLADEPLASRDPDAFVLTVMYGGAPGRGAAAPLVAMDDVLARLAGTGPDPGELARAMSRLAAGWYRNLARPRTRVQLLGAYETVRGRAELAWELAGVARSVTAGDVASAAAGLLASPRAVLHVRPGPPGPAAGPRIPAPGRIDRRERAMTAAAALRVPPVAGQPPAELAAAEQRLPSGLRVLAARRSGAPIVELRLMLRCGGDAAHAAAAELLAVTILGGTQHRDRRALDADLARLGATLAVAARPEYLLLSGYVLAQHAGRLLGLLGEVITGAAYPDHDVAAQRARLAGRLRAHAAQPHVIARQALLRRCYGDHPAATETPAEADLAAVGGEALRQLHRDTVLPRDAALVLVGEADPGQLAEAAGAALGGWCGDRPAPTLATPPPVPPGEVELLDDPAGRQVMVGLASPAPAEADPGYPAACLANLVLGGYFASRLFEHLREGLGHVYRCTSALDERAGRGAMLLEFATDPDGAEAALGQTYGQLRRIARADPPGPAEIDAARGYAVGSQAVKLATQGGLADALALLALRGQDLCWLPRRARRLAAVPDAQVRRWAARLFDPAAMTGFARGPAHLLAGAPSPLGGRIRPPAAEQPAPLPRVQPVHSPPVHGGRDD